MTEIYDATEREAAVIEATVSAVFKKFGLKKRDAELDVSFVSEEEIKEENKLARGVDSVTDVLSFQYLENISFPFQKSDYSDEINPETSAVMLGEILICRKRAEEQAEEYGHGYDREISFLVCHGLLHLLGYDHLDKDDEETMTAMQKEIIGTPEKPLVSFGSIVEDMELDWETDDEEDADEEDADGEEKSIYDSESPVKFGFIAVLGRPNAGKSTLVNAVVGEKVSIVSWKPQTTRNSIMGIYNDADSQIVFIDTPGLHAPANALGKYMMHGVTAALEETEFVLYVVDAERGLKGEDKKNLERYLAAGKKVIVALNKTDRMRQENIMGMMGELSELKDLSAIVPVSAIRGRNTEAVLSEIKKLLPQIEKRAFDADLYTTQNMRFMAAETIREKALRLLEDEIPYGVGVVVNKYEYRDNGILDIDADVVLESRKHKPIVLGKGGSMIKKISTFARQDLEEITGSKIFLTLWVRVKEAWRDNPLVLDNLGYNKKKSD